MDLREVKTKRNIRNAFLAIRSRKPLEKVTVRELCEQAEISKATFYLHYRDLYDLSEQLQANVVDEILGHLSHTEDLIYDPCKASRELITGFYAHRPLINILFSGSQFSRLTETIEQKIKDLLFTEYPSLKDDVYANVRLTYQLKGSFYAFYQYENSFGFEEVMAAVEKLTRHFEPEPDSFPLKNLSSQPPLSQR